MGQAGAMVAVDIARSLADAEPAPFWLDRPDRPAPRPPLAAGTTADLVVAALGVGAALLNAGVGMDFAAGAHNPLTSRT